MHSGSTADSSGGPSGPRPAFQVEGDPDMYDGPPRTAEEYLRRVRFERQQLPGTISVSASLELRPVAVSEGYIPTVQRPVECAEELKARPEWMRECRSMFDVDRRKVLARCEAEIANTRVRTTASDQASSSLSLASAALPDAKDVRGWLAYMSGEGNVPTVALLCSRTHSRGLAWTLRMVDALRERIERNVCQYEEGKSDSNAVLVSPGVAMWLFALVCVLPDPINAEISYKLRRLFIALAAVRALYGPGDECEQDVAHANVLMTIISEAFDQKFS
jgi:hypothetical protein